MSGWDDEFLDDWNAESQSVDEDIVEAEQHVIGDGELDEKIDEVHNNDINRENSSFVNDFDTWFDDDAEDIPHPISPTVTNNVSNVDELSFDDWNITDKQQSTVTLNSPSSTNTVQNQARKKFSANTNSPSLSQASKNQNRASTTSSIASDIADDSAKMTLKTSGRFSPSSSIANQHSPSSFSISSSVSSNNWNTSVHHHQSASHSHHQNFESSTANNYENNSSSSSSSWAPQTSLTPKASTNISSASLTPSSISSSKQSFKQSSLTAPLSSRSSIEDNRNETTFSHTSEFNVARLQQENSFDSWCDEDTEVSVSPTSVHPPPRSELSGHLGHFGSASSHYTSLHSREKMEEATTDDWGWGSVATSIADTAANIGSSLAPHDFGHTDPTVAEPPTMSSAHISSSKPKDSALLDTSNTPQSSGNWFSSLSSKASTFTRVFEEVKQSAGQSGLELLNVGSSLAADVMGPVSSLDTAATTHDTCVSSAISPATSKQISPISPRTPLTFPTDADEDSAWDKDFGGFDSESETSSLAIQEQNDALSSSVIQRHNEQSQVVPNEVEVNDCNGNEFEHRLSNTLPMTKVFCADVNIDSEVHPRNGLEPAASFESIFAEHGTVQLLTELSVISRRNFVLVMRAIPALRAAKKNTVLDTGECVRKTLNVLEINAKNGAASESDSHAYSDHVLTLIIANNVCQHKQVLELQLKQWISLWTHSTNRPQEADRICAQIHALCTRSLALLSAHVVRALVSFSKAWSDDEENVNAVSMAQFLCVVFQSCGREMQVMSDSGVHAFMKILQADNTNSAVSMLETDLQLEASEALAKLEDTIEAIAPILQAIAFGPAAKRLLLS